MNHPLVIKISKSGDDPLIVHHPDKQAEAADGLAQALGEKAVQDRGLYVYPLRKGERALFKALRRWFGGKGKVADWTRTWRGPWVLVLPGEHVRLPIEFSSHWAAVQEEVNLLLLGNGDIHRGLEERARVRQALVGA